MAFVRRTLWDLRSRSYDFAYVTLFDFLCGVLDAFLIRGALSMVSSNSHLLNLSLELGGISHSTSLGSIFAVLVVLFIVPIALSMAIWDISLTGYLTQGEKMVG
jgi:hypothetical protein